PWSVLPLASPGPHGDGSVPNVLLDAAAPPESFSPDTPSVPERSLEQDAVTSATARTPAARCPILSTFIGRTPFTGRRGGKWCFGQAGDGVRGWSAATGDPLVRRETGYCELSRPRLTGVARRRGKSARDGAASAEVGLAAVQRDRRPGEVA